MVCSPNAPEFRVCACLLVLIVSMDIARDRVMTGNIVIGLSVVRMIPVGIRPLLDAAESTWNR